MIPTSTGAAKAVGLVLPELNGKLDGTSIRVPTPNVSVVDFKFIAKQATSKDEINEAIKRAAEQQLKGVLGYTDQPNVSIDFNHDPHSSDLPPRPDQGHGRHARARHVVVRQRVGLLEPHGRHGRRHGEADLTEARMTAFRTLDQAEVGASAFSCASTSTSRWRTAGSPTRPASSASCRRSARSPRRAGRSILLAHFGRPKGRDPKESAEAGRGGARRSSSAGRSPSPRTASATRPRRP